jgi:hypothetical protein
VLGLAPEFEPDESDGWVIRRLSTLDGLHYLRDRGAYTSAAKAFGYILSHATFDPDGDKQAVTWFGEAHGSQFQADRELSEGALSVIERLSAEVTGAIDVDMDEDGVAGVLGDEDDARECPSEECGGFLRSIFDAPRFLGDRAWVDDVGREAEHRVAVAFEWVIGEANPPPGLRRPSGQEEYEEAMESLL